MAARNPKAFILASSPSHGASRDWFWGLALFFAVFLTYLPVWHAGFIWDDDWHVTANPCIVGPFGLKEIWTTSIGKYCPLVFTTFWLEHALWGLAPLPYHLVNVFLHGASAILLRQVLRSLRVPGAWLGAALWALHPVQVESVAWISEMKNTESGLFYVLTIHFFVKGLKAPGERRGEVRNYGLTLLFAALAMAAKSSTVVLPIVLGLCAWWVEGRWHWRRLAQLGPIFLMSIVASVLTIIPGTSDPAVIPDPQWSRSLPERLATAGDTVWFYLGKLLWPKPLIFVYPRWQVDANSPFSFLALLAVILVLFLLWRKRESWSRCYFFAFAYFVAALLPVLGLIDGFFWRYSLVGDHFQYLASMGPLALAGAGLAKLADLIIPARARLQSTLVAGLLLILGAMSWQRTLAFESDTELWTDTLAKNPQCWMAHNNLGQIFFNEGDLDQAIAQYEESAAIYPLHAKAYHNLGMAYFEKGQLDLAIAQYQRALALSPNFAETHDNLGNALALKGRLDEAISQYRQALAINPANAKAHNNLGCVLLHTGKVDEAIAQYQKAVAINPRFAEAYNNLGNALYQKGRFDEAIPQFQIALQLNPQNSTVQNNLIKAQAMARQGAH